MTGLAWKKLINLRINDQREGTLGIKPRWLASYKALFTSILQQTRYLSNDLHTNHIFLWVAEEISPYISLLKRIFEIYTAFPTKTRMLRIPHFKYRVNFHELTFRCRIIYSIKKDNKKKEYKLLPFCWNFIFDSRQAFLNLYSKSKRHFLFLRRNPCVLERNSDLFTTG